MPVFKVLQVFLSVSLLCSVLFFLPHAVSADGPSHEFYGTVSSSGMVVGAGYVVTAVVNGQEAASATTDAQGKWGVTQPFAVATSGCSLVEFYVNGEFVGAASSCIATNELNLTVSGAPQASASTASVATTTSPDVSRTEDSQPSLSYPSSSSTQTFFIGPQPSATPTTPAAPDSEDVLPPVDFPITNTSLQEGEASISPAGGGTAAQISVMEVLVMGAIAAWSILIVIVFLAIIRKRPDY